MAVNQKEYKGGGAAQTLSGSHNASTLTITLAADPGASWPTGASGKFGIVVDRGESNEEKILCDSRSAATITVNASGRGYDGTSAATHSSAAAVELCVLAEDLQQANDFLVLPDAKGDITAASAANTWARLAVGSNGQVLTADSGETAGVKWSNHGHASAYIASFPPWADANVRSLVANTAYFSKFYVSGRVTISALRTRFGTTGTSNIDMGIYSGASAPTTRLASTGSTAATDAAVSLTSSVTLVPGTAYWLAIACDNTGTQSEFLAPTEEGTAATDMTWLGDIYKEKASSFPLPASITSPSAASYIPLVVAFL